LPFISGAGIVKDEWWSPWPPKGTRMKLLHWLTLVAVLLLVLVWCPARAQDYVPPEPQQVDAALRKQIDEKMVKLADAITDLRRNKFDEPLINDIEVHYQAAYWITRHNEFFQKESAAWTVEALDRGLKRVDNIREAVKHAEELAKKGDRRALEWVGTLDWVMKPGTTYIRGYRSIVDGSVQPVAVTLPDGYGKDSAKRYRLDVVLHGRDKNLNEVKFLHQFGDKPAPKDLAYIRLDIYGRGNNAYRWAGEIDVLEAKRMFESVETLIGRGPLLDRRRQVLRGFSMGGAGTWHLGLHGPDRWCVLGPGAGFTATHGYIKNLPADLGWPQEQLLRIYDAVDYAENAFNVPVVAYGGSKDPQLQAARNIEQALQAGKMKFPFQILIAPDLEHKFPAEWQQKAEEAYAPFVAKGREEYPKRVHFVTYTTRYSACDWVDIVGLTTHYDKAVVDAERTDDGFQVSTTNVDMLRLRVPPDTLQDQTVLIDKQEVEARPWSSKGGGYYVYLARSGGKWKATLPQRIDSDQARKPRKIAGLQGPIDDAFTKPFLVVRGTGKPWAERVDDYADANLKRFKEEWAKYFRGDLPVKLDSDVTSDDINDKHLILFGDPGSNSMLASVLEGLPLTWTPQQFTFAGKTYASATHVPLLIYPNPLNASRYVVLNSGHTFHKADFEGTNALLYPRLGDYAVLRLPTKGQGLTVEQVERNGLFDEAWQVYPGK
jgi:dienelactone hydrolase